VCDTSSFYINTHLTSDAVPQARTRLTELLDHTLTLAHSSSEPILTINTYTPSSLQAVLASAHTSSATKYEAYLKRRKAGGPRELFPTQEHAKEWLKLAAVVKYVDGGWISSIMNEVAGTQLLEDDTRQGSTSLQAGKMAWQVISEEFGDGDLEKNHIFMYYALMDQLGVGARDPSDGTALPGHMKGFDGLREDEGVPRCWTAAIAQQCVGLLSTEYFAEALGFNMAYETLPYHLLVTSRELRELDIDDTYFALHITIDNADSGHAALARLAVERYLEGVKRDKGEPAMQSAWRRVQAGFLLADCLPTTPWSPIEFEKVPNSDSWRPASSSTSTSVQPANANEKAMAHLMKRKASAAEKMHCPSKMVIKKRTLEQWLDPSTLTEEKSLEFVRAMADSRVMIKKGDVAGSRLMKELEWGGRMFGAFSRGEVDVVRRWISSLGEDASDGKDRVTYRSFTGRILEVPSTTSDNPAGAHDVPSPTGNCNSPPSFRSFTDLLAYPLPALPSGSLPRLVPLWLTSLTLLQNFPLSPTKLSSPLGMSIIRLIRSQAGFAPLHQSTDICAGLDDFGMGQSQGEEHDVNGLWEVAERLVARRVGQEIRLVDMLNHGQKGTMPKSRKITRDCESLLEMRNSPYKHQADLLGLTLGFARALHGHKSVEEALDRRNLNVDVKRIVSEEVETIRECIEVELDRRRGTTATAETESTSIEEYWSDFVRGYVSAVDMVREHSIEAGSD
jgi:hypothetical protein